MTCPSGKKEKALANSPTPQSPLAATAHWTAAVRALENARDEPLFRDPWASLLAGKEGEESMSHRSAVSVIPIVLRTRFFDDFLERVVRRHAIRQVILMAAGLDTRAYRMAWPDDTTVYELDRPEVLGRKAQLLHSVAAAPRCQRKVIEVGLKNPWEEPLREAGYDAASPSVWLLEGFLFYLPVESVARILALVSRLAAPGSWLGFDIINTSMLTSALTQPWVEMQARAGAPWVGTLDDPEAFLSARGWLATLCQAGQPDAHHGRWLLPVIPTKMANVPHNWFVVAEKGAPPPA